jgi:hypothetical protein
MTRAIYVRAVAKQVHTMAVARVQLHGIDLRIAQFGICIYMQPENSPVGRVACDLGLCYPWAAL